MRRSSPAHLQPPARYSVVEGIKFSSKLIAPEVTPSAGVPASLHDTRKPHCDASPLEDGHFQQALLEHIDNVGVAAEP